MARKRSPIVRKALGLIAASLRPVACRSRRPIARKRPIHGYTYYVSDYEFSPPPRKRSRRFLSLLCGGNGDELEAESDLQMLFEEGGEEEEEEGDANVDERAERFIEKFYEEIRNQTQASKIDLCSFSAD